MDKLLQKLVPPVSVSGREEEISRVIETLAKPYGQISRDHLGNLVVHKPGNGRRILLAAHMDTIGLIVTHVDEKGFVRFAAIGGLRLVPMIGLIMGQSFRGCGFIPCISRPYPKSSRYFVTLSSLL